ncbi:MAG: glycosyltransferase family 39 protein [Candidatus Omnitrophica bacterium]|nr:glycosyltransferase family 39 protein [Candidatus Omnitrophota bacterium]MCM8827699.1 glycosyltransferase family 39 protein [Candidatus Omnitrophota bacterium]
MVDLVTGDSKLLESLTPIMVETRREIRQMIKIPGDKYSDIYNENKVVSIEYGNRRFNLTPGQINAIRTYLLRTYYPDEHITIVALTNINPRKKQFSPEVLIPGAFYVYSTGLYLAICHYFGIIKITNNLDFYLANPGEMARIYLLIRFLNLIAFFFSIYLVWMTGKTIWNEKVGLISSFLFGVSPVLNLWNHFGYYYTFSLPFVILAFFFSARILMNNITKDYALAGVFSGISMSIVMLYGMSVSFLLVSCLMVLTSSSAGYISKETVKKVLIGLTSMLCAFFVINIFLLADFKTLCKLIKFEQGDFIFSPQPFFFIFGSLKSAVGWPFLLAAMAGYILLFIKKDRFNLFFAVSTILPLIVLFCFSPWYARRAIFLVPFLALSSGIFCDWLKKKSLIAGNIFLLFTLAFTFVYSAAFTETFARENTREKAGRWINANIQDNSKIGLLQLPAPYRTPPFHFWRYKLIGINWDKKALEQFRPDYFIISEYETQSIDEAKVYSFFENYSKIKEFKKTPSFAGISFNRTRFSARDFWISSPCITIYKRKNVER